MCASPFAIDIEKLRQGKVEIEVDEVPENLDLVDLPDARFEENITGRLTYSLSGTDVFIRGRLKTRACAECVRCLQPACYDLDVKISLNFLGKGPEEEQRAFEEQIEELDVDYYEGEVLDPLPQIRDTILLEIPTIPVCIEECRGLCPQCGINLNTETCSCHQPELAVEEDTWKNKLKGFKLE